MTGPPAPHEDPTWPAPVVTRVLDAFGGPASRVIRLDWPIPHRPTPLGASAQGWARIAATLATSDHHPCSSERAALIMVALPPAGPDTTEADPRPVEADDFDDVAERVMHRVAGLLRPGGTLAVLTHIDLPAPRTTATTASSITDSDTVESANVGAARRTGGELVDRSGALVRAGQNADLLYLQHIVVVHARYDTDGLDTGTAPPPVTEPDTTSSGRSTHDLRHHRIHSDLLVFSQPRDHQSAPRTHTAPDPHLIGQAAVRGGGAGRAQGGLR